MVKLLDAEKICKNCACYKICIYANPDRVEACTINWQPIITYCSDCQYLKICRACYRCNHPVGLKEPNPKMNTFCVHGIKMEDSSEHKTN